MLVSYNVLWKLLIDRNMKKIDLVNEIGISSSTIAKMNRESTYLWLFLERYAINEITILAI